MIRDLLHDMGGIGLYGLASMFLFVAFFGGVVVWVFFLRKPYIRHMSHLPLDDDEALVPGKDEP